MIAGTHLTEVPLAVAPVVFIFCIGLALQVSQLFNGAAWPLAPHAGGQRHHPILQAHLVFCLLTKQQQAPAEFAVMAAVPSPHPQSFVNSISCVFRVSWPESLALRFQPTSGALAQIC